jgi:uncharacterized protein
MAKFRILSIDGGGIRGIVSVVLLQRLSREAGVEGWLDNVQLIAGTSTGGLIALALAAGKSLAEIRDMYVTKGADIFHRSVFRAIANMGSILGAKYDIANLERVIKPFLGETTTLGNLKRVLIASFDLDSGPNYPGGRRWKPKLFHNFPGEDSDANELAYKVGLYTSAAPTYFQPADGFVDGGVYAANPSMCALAQTQDTRIKGGGPRLDEIVLFSLGTGVSLKYIEPMHPDWGDAQWIEPLLAIMLDGVSGIADFECGQLLRDRYLREAPVFPPGTDVPMDAVDQIPFMIDFASSVDLTKAAAWLRATWI